MKLKGQTKRLTASFAKEGKAMKRIGVLVVVTCIFVMFVGTAYAGDVYVRGYFRSNGTYVQPHYRSAPDGNFSNNWSTYPNVNPYTGKMGTLRTPSHSSTPRLGSSYGYGSFGGHGSSNGTGSGTLW